MASCAPFVNSEGIVARKPSAANVLFAERLRVALAKKGWKAARLAKELGVSRQLASSWTRGRAKPSGPTSATLPALLGVEVEWLFPKGATAPVRVPGLPQGERSRVSEGSVGDPGPRAQGGDAASSVVGLVRDALLGAVDRALARDHELEETRRGYRILGDAFIDLGLKLQLNGVDTHELMTCARELQKMGEP